MVALALAINIASPVTRLISSFVTRGDDEKPQVPFTITRTPKPKLESSVTVGTASVRLVPRSGESRRAMRWLRRRTIRMSQYGALYFLASARATAPSFSRSALGLLEPFGAAKRFDA